MALRRRALEHSLPAYLVGGPVRDGLMGAPIRDLDFVVEGDAPAVARQLADELGGRALTYDRFGTATVVLEDCRVDLVTARQEVYPHPGALPQVSPGTIFDDLARRDFSINALALPLTESRPKVLDPLGGIGDIDRGLIRVLHGNSFVDDATRISGPFATSSAWGFASRTRPCSNCKAPPPKDTWLVSAAAASSTSWNGCSRRSGLTSLCGGPISWASWRRCILPWDTIRIWPGWPLAAR